METQIASERTSQIRSDVFGLVAATRRYSRNAQKQIKNTKAKKIQNTNQAIRQFNNSAMKHKIQYDFT